MALCRDKSLSFLNDKGYNVVRVPRAGIEPLDLLGRDQGAMEWLGRLGSLWRSPQSLPPILPVQPAADIEGQRTDNLEIGAGLSLLKGVLSVFNAGAGLDAAYHRASTLEFAYANVTSVRVAPLEIGAFLARGTTDRNNPVIDRYFLGDEAEGFVLTEVLKSDRLKVTAKSSHGETIKVDVDQISATLGANARVSVSQGAQSALVYTGNVPVTFAFRLLRIDVEEDRWVTRGAKASGALSFDMTDDSGEPPALATHELLDIPPPETPMASPQQG
jgi:hypothetical protein